MQDVEGWGNELSNPDVVALGPVVTGASLTEDKVVRTELSERGS